MAAVEIKNLWKKFRIYHESHITLEKTLYSFFKRRRLYEDFWALRDISFEVKEGEVLGVIGKNGSGKTTLLRLIAKILTPNRGYVQVNGETSAFLGLGTGFHPDLTGLENLYLYGSMLRLRRSEVKNRLGAIIKFAELGRFIDVPLRNFSSGMRMRLAFAMAVNVDPDILLIDEVLAVGDLDFTEKSFQKVKEFKNRNKTIILTSQNMNRVKQICDRGILLDRGTIKSIGNTEKVINDYLGNR